VGAAGALTVNNTHTAEKHTLKRIFLAVARAIVNLLSARAAVINDGGEQISEARQYTPGRERAHRSPRRGYISVVITGA